MVLVQLVLVMALGFVWNVVLGFYYFAVGESVVLEFVLLL